ncbi:MAG: GGDEF domain-containing protein [Castellaniella sp.]|uniref:GGDEF domain-containing protein n=1 Tax=Castellaniella sp. TaxID=1955812 RepID=UPI003C720148
MHAIDPATLVVVITLLAVLLAAIMLTMRTSFPRTIGGIDQWSAATVLVIVAAALFTLRKTPPFFHVTLANGFMLLAMIYMASGMLRMFRLRLPPRRPVLAAAAGITLAMAWYTYVQPSFQARLFIMALLGVCAFGYMSWLPLRHGRRGIGSLVTAFAFGLTALSCLVRLSTLMIRVDDPGGLFDPGTLQVIYLATFNVTLLIATVGFILMANEQLRDTLEFSATHDALTGVLNRGAFFERANTEFERSRRDARPLAIALMDLDHFKQINDKHGHQAGDRVLVDFCTTVRAALRPGDFLGRYGGEEFIVLLPDATHAEAAAAMQRLLDTVRPGLDLPLYTFSIGYAALEPGTAGIDDLLIAADKALYQAKENGRGRAEAGGAPGA